MTLHQHPHQWVMALLLIYQNVHFGDVSVCWFENTFENFWISIKQLNYTYLALHVIWHDLRLVCCGKSLALVNQITLWWINWFYLFELMPLIFFFSILRKWQNLDSSEWKMSLLLLGPAFSLAVSSSVETVPQSPALLSKVKLFELVLSSTKPAQWDLYLRI